MSMFFGVVDTLPSDSADSRDLQAPSAPRKRVIWLQNSADHYFVQMLDALNAQGTVEYFVVFLCPPPAASCAADNYLRAIPHAFLGDPVVNAGPEGHRALGKAARDYIRHSSFSMAIVGGYDSRLKRWMIRYCHRRGLPIALIADSNIRAERGKSMGRRARRWVKRLLLCRIIRKLSMVLPLNRSGVAYWRYYGCPVNKISRSTYFCAVDVPAALALNREELFARYKLPPGDKLIFTAARLVPAKALHLMVEAFTKSGLEDQGWVWAVAGDGPLRQKLEKQAGNLNGSAIRFLGAVAPIDIPALMAQSELFVLPSVYEPHGIVVQESLAVGTPVIAGNLCGAALDLVQAGQNGWFFKAGSEASLRSAIGCAVRDPTTLRAMRKRCRSDFGLWYGRYAPTITIPAAFSQVAAPNRVGF